MIDRFDGEYRWLSNFYPARIEWMGREWPSLEHAYVATKCEHYEDVETIAELETAGKVKRFGRKLAKEGRIRGDWAGMRLDTMRGLLARKFQIPELREKLLATGDDTIVEGNNWHDNFYGSCLCDTCGNKGENYLGKLLMALRTKLREADVVSDS